MFSKGKSQTENILESNTSVDNSMGQNQTENLVDTQSVSQSSDILDSGEDIKDEFVEIKEREVLTPDDVKELAPLYSNVVIALKQVYDPEIPVNIYDLGLIYELNIDKGHNVYIKMTFTAPNCPMADYVMDEVKKSVEDVPSVNSCNIELVFEPAWDQSMLSEEARVELGLD